MELDMLPFGHQRLELLEKCAADNCSIARAGKHATALSMLEGGCFCGFVRYQAEGPISEATNCHCSMCRRISGAPFVAWVTVPKQGFLVRSGEPAILHSSERASRTFCPRCGTPLTFSSKETPSEVDLTLCSLDRPEDVRPEDHTWVSSKLSWIKLCDGLPQFPRTRR